MFHFRAGWGRYGDFDVPGCAPCGLAARRPSCVPLVGHAQLAGGIGLGIVSAREGGSDVARVLLGLGKVDGDLEFTPPCRRGPLDIAGDRRAAHVSDVAAQTVEPIGGVQRSLFPAKTLNNRAMSEGRGVSRPMIAIEARSRPPALSSNLPLATATSDSTASASSKSNESSSNVSVPASQAVLGAGPSAPMASRSSLYAQRRSCASMMPQSIVYRVICSSAHLTCSCSSHVGVSVTAMLRKHRPR